MEFSSKFKIKDRSRFTSSILISLIAGFIYFQFGNDIQEKIIKSVKAISSNSLDETFGPEYCGSFNSLINKSDKKIKKVKSGFYIKNKSKTDINSSDLVSSENMISEIIKIQAITQKAIPDKNIDFSLELDNLIDRNSVSELNEKINRITKTDETRDAIANENCNTEKVIIRIQTSELYGFSKIDINKNGYGFEFNNTDSKKIFTENRNSSKNSSNFYFENNFERNIDCAKSKDIEIENSHNKVKKVYQKSEKIRAEFIEDNSDSIDSIEPNEPNEPEIFIQDENIEEGNN